ncbi:acyltransferase [Halomonas sp. TRM85114]|uniref:acyltransferase family protein n=1 Tax=Halomonas jincaotanensis TaxID=2810616 RepID=UPI001BD5FADA|nr:acyltransferase family protein [Halomonas jincaotanensis]MBS9404258.1 acyltransferase [Halomonas jincaotanensis]
MKFRKDIQMVRGISVLFVVLYHLQIASMQSGFLGVDVFFVISGFLMAVLYQEGKAKEFFRRRAKRLLPAYFVTILASLLLAIFITLPTELDQVVEQSLFATFFASNLGFWMQNSYFGTREFAPLLHLWSLGVEIQYYLLVPLLFYVFKKIRFSYFLILVGSASLCFVMTTISPKTSFFMVPLRLWEFLLGYGAATFLTLNGNVKYTNKSWMGGVAIIVLAAIPFMPVDGQAQSVISGHPGIAALIVCLATTAVMSFGLPVRLQASWAGDSLTLLGKYSYSIYLAHFPVIVLYLYEPFSGTVMSTGSFQDTLILCGLIAVLSLALYHGVEKPSQNVNVKKVLPATMLATLLLSLTAHASERFRYDSSERAIFNAWEDRATYRCGKIFRLLNPLSISCELSGDRDMEHGDAVMLVGNSHADSIKTEFVEVAEDYGKKVYFMVPNNPLMPGGPSIEAVLNEAIERDVSEIVLHYDADGLEQVPMENLVKDAGEKNIIVSLIMPVPSYDSHIPEALWHQKESGRPIPRKTIEEYVEENKKSFDLVERIDALNFFYYETADYLCKEECSVTDASGKPLYFDAHHLTLSGAKVIDDAFELSLE